MSEVVDHVSVSITSQTSQLSQQGFGLPLIVSHTAAWTERVREYASLAGVLADFAASTPEYLAASKLFGQNPRPPKLLIGRAALKPTQRWALTPTAVNSFTYKVKVNGTEVTFTSDGSATVAEIIAGLKAAIDALALAITTSDQTTFLRVLANTAGAFFSLEVTSGNLEIAQDHADPGMATDLAAIALERNDWYGLVSLYNSKALVDATAAWAQSNSKFYAAQTQDSAVMNTVLSGTDDVGESLRGSAYDTLLIHHPATDAFADAAALGARLPTVPGSETWKFARLVGVTPASYTPTQRTNMRNKRVNFYETTGGEGMLEEGICSSGSFADFVRYRDFQKARIAERVFGALATPTRVPYNDRGIQTIAGEVRAQLQSDEAREVLEPGSTVKVPKRSAQTTADRNARLVAGLEYSCVYTGAIHKVTISGVISV